MTHAHNRFWAIAAIAAGLLAAAVPARAEVRDEAGFFSARVEQQANERMQRIRQQHGKDVVVETLPALANAPGPGKAREEFLQTEATRRGQEAGVNGLYVMISRKPSSFYIGIDPDTQRQMFTPGDRVRVRDVIMERFNANDFDGGLVAALDAIEKTFAANASGTGKAGAAAAGAGAAGGAAAAPAPAQSTPRAADGGGKRTDKGGGLFSGIGGWLCLIIAGLAVFALVRGMMRRRQMAAQGYGQPGPGQPGYGQPGYDPRYPQQQGGMMGGGGGMGRGILGGLLGGMAGGYLYDQMRGPGGGNEANAATPPPDPGSTPVEPDAGFGGGDFGGGDAGGGDFGGGDFGGGDFGGGDAGGGGDFGGGDFGGGDFGGGE